MPTVGVLNVAIKGTTKGLEGSIGRVGGLLKGLGGTVAKLGALFGGLSVAGAFAAFNKMSENLDALAKAANTLGVTTEELSELRFAAQRSGIEVAGLETSLQRMRRSIGEASFGKGTGVEALRQLGLDAQQLMKLPIQEQLLEISRAMQEIPNASQRIAVGFQLFGRQGVNLIRFMQKGDEELRGLIDNARKFGATVSQETAIKMEMFQDSMLNLKTAMAAVGRQVADFLSPFMVALAEQMAAWAATANKSGAGVHNALAPVKKILDVIANVITGLVGGFNLLQAGIAKVVELAARVAAKLPLLSDETKRFFEILAEEESRAASDLFEKGLARIDIAMEGGADIGAIIPKGLEDFLQRVDGIRKTAREAAEETRRLRREGQMAGGIEEVKKSTGTKQVAIAALERGSVEAVAKISEIFSADRQRDLEKQQLDAQKKAADEIAKLRQHVEESGGWLAVEDVL